MGKFFTPPPKSVHELSVIVLETIEGIADAKSWLADKLSETTFRAAAYSMGVEIDGEVTTDSIGLAIGKKVFAETGLQLGNVFDGEALRVKVERAGIARVIQELGVDAPATREGLADAVKVVVRRRIEEKIGEGAADALVGVMGSADDVAAILAAVKRREKPLLTSAAAVGNRERQARFRQTHKRV